MLPPETLVNEPQKEVQKLLAALTERMASFKKRLPVASRSDQERGGSPPECNWQALGPSDFTRIKNMLEDE